MPGAHTLDLPPIHRVRGMSRRPGRERDPQQLMSVSIETSPSFVVHESRPLFRDGAYESSPDRTAYDVHPSGQWFAMTRNTTTKADLIVVLDWFSELRTKMAR